MAETNKEISYKCLTRMAKPFGRAGQVSTRKLSPESGYVASVLYSERVGESNDVNHTTLIVKDKEFEKSHEARSWMEGRLKELFG